MTTASMIAIAVSGMCDGYWLTRFVAKARAGKVTGGDILWLALNITVTVYLVVRP